MMKIKSLSLDLETFSSVDLSKCGVYRYCESPDFEILLFGYAINGGDVQVVDLACGEKIPADVLAALDDETVIKWAYNSSFERVCLSRYLGLPTGDYLDSASWKCSMVWSAYMGLPQSLGDVGAVLGLEKQKLTEGKELIRYFCVPCKPTKANGGRTRNLPEHDREKWKRFKAYNLRDVEAEMQIQQKLSKFPVPEFVWEEYWLDQEVNDRGIGVDMEMVAQAIAMDARAKAELTTAMKELTELDNPNSVQQMKQWLAENGLETDSLDKKAVAGLLKTAPEPLRTVLTLRQQLAKSSVKKYQAMQNAVCTDSRARGMFKFYGANRTGRFCLAESTPVLVKDAHGRVYEKPIEDVLKTDLVFDGENWVQHEGVVFSGEKEVIEWDGIIATPEHQVFIDENTKIPLKDAKEMKLALWKGKEKPIYSFSKRETVRWVYKYAPLRAMEAS